MSRDRKLLCFILAIAMASQALLFATLYQMNYGPSVDEALHDAASCRALFTHLYARHAAGHSI